MQGPGLAQPELDSVDDTHKDKRDKIVSGSIVRTVLSLALPVVAGMAMEFALATTDFYWVGRLGATAQDAITSSMVVIWTIFASISIVVVGVTALVSRYVGARDYSQVSFYIRQGLSMSLLLGVVISTAGFVFTPALLNFMEAGPATVALAMPYLRVFFVSATFFIVIDTVYAVFRASGDTRTPMIVGITTVLVNMALDPLLIFGWGPVPAMGVTGASVATLIAVAVGLIIIMTKLHRGKLGYKTENLYRLKPDFGAIMKIGRIGLPMATQQFVFVAVYWFLIRFVHDFGVEAAAAMGIGNRMESFSYLTCYGFSLAASTMVGQNLGAKQPERAARCAWGAAGTAIGLTSLITILFLAVPEWIASVFSDDPAVIAIAADYLIILGISQTAMAIEIVLEGAFGGAGDTIPPMLVMLPGSALRIPLAYYLCFTLGWGVNGIWWTLTITSIAKALVLAGWFKLGRWKKNEI